MMNFGLNGVTTSPPSHEDKIVWVVEGCYMNCPKEMIPKVWTKGRPQLVQPIFNFMFFLKHLQTKTKTQSSTEIENWY